MPVESLTPFLAYHLYHLAITYQKKESFSNYPNRRMTKRKLSKKQKAAKSQKTVGRKQNTARIRER